MLDTEGWKRSQEKRKQRQEEEYRERLKNYEENPSTCTSCGDAITYKKRSNKFCSSSCSATFNNKIRRSKEGNEDCIGCGIVKLKGTQTKFCSKKCKSSHTYLEADLIDKECAHCRTKLRTNQRKYCSPKCSSSGRASNSVDRWLAYPQEYKELPKFIRKYLLKKSGYKCSLCNWGKVNPHSNTYPLIADHINGNSQDNRPENLRIICPNCDSLTPTYKSLNKGNGRHSRKMRYSEGKSF
jgi:hypothetical protein